MTNSPHKFQNLREALEISTGQPRLLLRRGDLVIHEMSTDIGLPLAPHEFANRTVMIAASQVNTIAALIELDGLAKQIILAPPDATPNVLEIVTQKILLDFILTDRDDLSELASKTKILAFTQSSQSPSTLPLRRTKTEWILFTSGTTGVPKLVAHTFATLTDVISPISTASATVWGTFYDIRRYGGLQIFLRVALTASSLVLFEEGETLSSYLMRLRGAQATHISGTPSHWRAALMTSTVEELAPTYIRLSGEIVDQSIIDALSQRYQQARIVHAFASTEAGVAFEVSDKLSGFPAEYLDSAGSVQLRIKDDCIQIKSPRCALRYAFQENTTLTDIDGYVDTNDVVELRNNRCYFMGRRNGTINVGGLKIHPEEVEAVINAHPTVRSSRVSARKNPILGSIVVADIILDEAYKDFEQTERATIDTLLDYCRKTLPSHKAPTSIRIVKDLKLTAAGKLLRNG